MKVVVIVRDGLVQEAYSDDPNMDVVVIDLDDQYCDRGETEPEAVWELAEDARINLHRVW